MADDLNTQAAQLDLAVQNGYLKENASGQYIILPKFLQDFTKAVDTMQSADAALYSMGFDEPSMINMAKALSNGQAVTESNYNGVLNDAVQNLRTNPANPSELDPVVSAKYNVALSGVFNGMMSASPDVQVAAAAPAAAAVPANDSAAPTYIAPIITTDPATGAIIAVPAPARLEQWAQPDGKGGYAVRDEFFTHLVAATEDINVRPVDALKDMGLGASFIDAWQAKRYPLSVRYESNNPYADAAYAERAKTLLDHIKQDGPQSEKPFLDAAFTALAPVVAAPVPVQANVTGVAAPAETPSAPVLTPLEQWAQPNGNGGYEVKKEFFAQLDKVPNDSYVVPVDVFRDMGLGVDFLKAARAQQFPGSDPLPDNGYDVYAVSLFSRIKAGDTQGVTPVLNAGFTAMAPVLVAANDRGITVPASIPGPANPEPKFPTIADDTTGVRDNAAIPATQSPNPPVAADTYPSDNANSGVAASANLPSAPATTPLEQWAQPDGKGGYEVKKEFFAQVNKIPDDSYVVPVDVFRDMGLGVDFLKAARAQQFPGSAPLPDNGYDVYAVNLFSRIKAGDTQGVTPVLNAGFTAMGPALVVANDQVNDRGIAPAAPATSESVVASTPSTIENITPINEARESASTVAAEVAKPVPPEGTIVGTSPGIDPQFAALAVDKGWVEADGVGSVRISDAFINQAMEGAAGEKSEFDDRVVSNLIGMGITKETAENYKTEVAALEIKDVSAAVVPNAIKAAVLGYPPDQLASAPGDGTGNLIIDAQRNLLAPLGDALKTKLAAATPAATAPAAPVAAATTPAPSDVPANTDGQPDSYFMDHAAENKWVGIADSGEVIFSKPFTDAALKGVDTTGPSLDTDKVAKNLQDMGISPGTTSHLDAQAKLFQTFEPDSESISQDTRAQIVVMATVLGTSAQPASGDELGQRMEEGMARLAPLKDKIQAAAAAPADAPADASAAPAAVAVEPPADTAATPAPVAASPADVPAAAVAAEPPMDDTRGIQPVAAEPDASPSTDALPAAVDSGSAAPVAPLPTVPVNTDGEPDPYFMAHAVDNKWVELAARDSRWLNKGDVVFGRTFLDQALKGVDTTGGSLDSDKVVQNLRDMGISPNATDNFNAQLKIVQSVYGADSDQNVSQERIAGRAAINVVLGLPTQPPPANLDEYMQRTHEAMEKLAPLKDKIQVVAAPAAAVVTEPDTRGVQPVAVEPAAPPADAPAAVADSGSAAPAVPAVAASAAPADTGANPANPKPPVTLPGAAAPKPSYGDLKPPVKAAPTLPATPAALVDPASAASSADDMSAVDKWALAVQTVYDMEHHHLSPDTIKNKMKHSATEYVKLLAQKPLKRASDIQAAINALSPEELVMATEMGSGRAAVLRVLATQPKSAGIKDMSIADAITAINTKDSATGLLNPHLVSASDKLALMSTRTGHGPKWLAKMLANTDAKIAANMEKKGLLVNSSETASDVVDGFKKKVDETNKKKDGVSVDAGATPSARVAVVQTPSSAP